jgi:hypothetical protein
MNVPLSVGPQYKDVDNKGVDCFVYDIIVNPKVLDESKDDETGQYRDFLCHLSIQSVEQKYGKLGNLNKQYKLPKLKYMGAVIQSQYIRDRKSVPKIEEVSEKQSAPSSGTKKQAKKGSSLFVDKKEFVQLDKDLQFKLIWIKHNNPCENSENKHDISINSNGNGNGSTVNECPINFHGNGSDYTEPILIPDEDIKGLTLIIDFPGVVEPNEIDVKLSPFKFQVGYLFQYFLSFV